MTTPPEPVTINDVWVYRSSDGGVTWAVIQKIPAALGFARNGAPDTYQMVAAPPGDANNVAMLGMAGYDGLVDTGVQQQVWISPDQGTSWAINTNWAVPFFNGEYQVFGPGGLCVFPGTRPVIVGGVRSPQGSIVG